MERGLEVKVGGELQGSKVGKEVWKWCLLKGKGES